MLTLEQVRELEARVAKALAFIDRLSSENASLRERLSGYELRIKDLEILVKDFQHDQSRIEEGILHALRKLDAFEDSVLDAAPPVEGDDDPEPMAAAGSPATASTASNLIRGVSDDETLLEEGEELLDEESPPEAASRDAKADEDEAAPPSSGELDIF